MYRGRDEALRIYEAKKRFYILKAEELEEQKKRLDIFEQSHDSSSALTSAARAEFESQQRELEALREEAHHARKETEDRLRRLDRQTCEVLYLKYIKQLTVSEICGKLNYSMQRIYQLLNKGVDLYLTKYCPEELLEERCL